LLPFVVVADLVDAPVADGLKGGWFALAAIVADPVNAGDEAVIADRDELCRTHAPVAGSLLELSP
jgi:hypothetical protein